jgi:hypothetical protein
VLQLRHPAHARRLPPGAFTATDFVDRPRRVEATAAITIARQSSDDVPLREIFVLVDGKEIAMLRHGERVTHELPAGPHRVLAHNTLFSKAHDIVLRPGEHARFVAINRAGWGTLGWLMLLGAAPIFLTFDRCDA